jgi:hypothetical protein
MIAESEIKARNFSTSFTGVLTALDLLPLLLQAHYQTEKFIMERMTLVPPFD